MRNLVLRLQQFTVAKLYNFFLASCPCVKIANHTGISQQEHIYKQKKVQQTVFPSKSQWQSDKRNWWNCNISSSFTVMIQHWDSTPKVQSIFFCTRKEAPNRKVLMVMRSSFSVRTENIYIYWVWFDFEGTEWRNSIPPNEEVYPIGDLYCEILLRNTSQALAS